VGGRIEASIFTDDALRLLQAFADEAGLAVERGRLLQDAARVQGLEQADQLKTALLAAVSHDLRTPLAAIKAAASSLLQPDVAWDEATQREFLEAIDEETDRLTALVANLLDLSRIEGGALKPERDWYDLKELIETAVARLSRELAAHPVTVEVGDDVGEVSLDYVQISQVAANLLDNAAKFSPPGTPIRVQAWRSGDRVVVSVDDGGPGIPTGERSRIFEPFQRGRSARGAPGTGLGLAISRGLVEAHGGSIRVEDGPGGAGCRLVFELPSPVAPAPRLAPALVS
jgi:two-component system sensor histidine kinase KdpD